MNKKETFDSHLLWMTTNSWFLELLINDFGKGNKKLRSQTQIFIFLAYN